MLLRISAWKSDSYSANALIVAFSVEICQVIKDLYDKHDYIFDRNCLNEDEKEHFRKKSANMEDYLATGSLKALSNFIARLYVFSNQLPRLHKSAQMPTATQQKCPHLPAIFSNDLLILPGLTHIMLKSVRELLCKVFHSFSKLYDRTEKGVNTDKKWATPEPIQIPTPIPAPTIAPNPDLPDSETEWVKFKLEHPEGYPINQKEYEELYEATFYIGGNDLDEMMKSEITIWLNSCAVNAPLDDAVTSSGNSTSYYVNLEESFSSETLRSSNLLDDLIDGREELMESRPNEALAWLLANHMQTYALNYLYQTDCKKSILYFYMGSIQDTRRSLEFEADGETKLDRIRYLQARYKDIADCTHIDEEDCLQALKIYVAIENALKELGLA